MEIGNYSFPDDLIYDREHNWARISGNAATIGMTDFGQDLAGEIIYAEAPLVGREITFGEPFISIESGKWVGRIKAIVTGKIIEANGALEWEGNLINDDPYGEGWLAKVELSVQPEGLLKADDPEFAEFIASEREKHGK